MGIIGRLGEPAARLRGTTGVAALALALAPAAALAALVVYSIYQRVTFPLSLEWLEGSQILHAHRVLQGLPVYRVGSAGFLPHPYPPVHFLVVAGVGALFGLDYATARAVSAAALLLATALVCRQVWRRWPGARGERATLMVVMGGYVAATYVMVAGWYDTARVDSVALALVLLAAAPLARRDPPWSHVLLSAALACAAIYTKQTTVFFAAALCVVVFLQDRRKGVAMAAAMALICVAALLALQHVTDGGFSVWLLTMRHHVFHPTGLLGGLWVLVSRAPFLLLVPLLAWRRDLSAPAVLLLALLLAALPAGLIPYAKQGGSTNSLIPAWFLAGPTVLLLLGERLQAAPAATRRGALAAVLTFQAVYLLFFFFEPTRAWQGAAGVDRARAMNQVLSRLQGGLVCPVNPFLPVRNGQPTPQAGWLAHTDAMWARMAGVTPESYARWLAGTGARWLLLTADPVNEQEARLRRILEKDYVLDRDLGAPSWDGMWQTNPLPGVLYRRRSLTHAARAAPP